MKPVVALCILTALNLLNYVDRYVVSALLPQLQNHLQLRDSQGGLIASAFMVVYFILSPLFGWLGDRGRRVRWLTLGVVVWSLATAASALAWNFHSLLAARAMVGVGEAAYGTIAPSLLADYFPAARRGRILAYFYMANPVGSALGYILGGVLGAKLGWREALCLVGLPGLALALLALRLPEPHRGASDAMQAEAAPPLGVALRRLATNRLYVGTVAGYTAFSFAIGAMAFWMPTYMMRVRGYEQAVGMAYFGGATVATGLIGTLLGGILGDRLMRHTPKGYSLVNTFSMVGAAVGSCITLQVADPTAFLICLVLTQICMFLGTGPINALIVGSVPPQMRAIAVAMSIFSIHLLGDASSPTIVGALSDRSSLTEAMLIVPAFYGIAGLLWATTLIRRRTA